VAAPPHPEANGPLRRSHPALARLRRLSRRREARRSEGVVLVDGPVLLAEAVGAGVEVLEVFCEADVDVPVDVQCPVRSVAPGELVRVLDLVTPQGLVTVVRQPTAGIEEVLDCATAVVRPFVVGVEIQDPGNLGTLIRLSEAAGAAGIVLTGGTADVWGPKAVRAAAGSSFRLPVALDVEISSLLDVCAARGIPMIATVPRAGSPPDQLDLSGVAAFCIGNEARGLPAPVVDQSAMLITIPMEGRVESLNAAVAGSIVMFEAARQRRQLGGGGSQIGDSTNRDGAP